MNLIAVLIARDEAATLPTCLSSLGGVVDGVHVHDTGSTDDTVAVARSLGATVSAGAWTGDFAAARNAAVTASGAAGWVLSIDADERLHAHPGRLRALLDGDSPTAFLVEIDNRHDELPYTFQTARLFRPAALRWTGRVHEHLSPAGDHPAAPRDTIRLEHAGYADPGERHRKATRNAALAQATLDELARQRQPDPEAVAGTLLDLGRSFAGAGRSQDAVNAFETLRELCPGTRQSVLGTDALARLLLGAGLDDAVVALVAQLRAANVESQYCDWLEAQALAQLGRVEEAWRLLRGVRAVVDPAGRRYPPARLAELKELLSRLVGAGSRG